MLENFRAIDRGNCNPRFMSMTLNRVPITKAVLSKVGAPFAVRCQPLADQHDGELDIPTIDFGEDGPLRCSRCKGYLNPFVKFTDYEKKWQCNLCHVENEVPRGYQTYQNGNGDRLELNRGTVEFLAGKDMKGGVQRESVIVFAVDVSHKSILSGLLDTVLKTIRALLPSFPSPEHTHVGILTFSSNLHFYDVSSSLDEDQDPKICVVSDVADPFSALPTNRWMCKLDDSNSLKRLHRVLDMIPKTFNLNTVKATEIMSCGCAAVRAALDALSESGGTIHTFLSGIPNVGYGKLNIRENKKMYGEESEKTLYCPQNAEKKGSVGQIYKSLSLECVSRQVCVNIYAASSYYACLGKFFIVVRFVQLFVLIHSFNSFRVFQPTSTSTHTHTHRYTRCNNT